MNLKKYGIFIALLSLPLFGYLFWHVSTPSTLIATLSPYEKAGEQVKESLSSLPALLIKEEDTKYTIEDTLTEGIEITYPNQTNKEESTEESKPSLTLRFPKKYASEPMEVEIVPGKTILIQDKNATGDYTSESLSLGNTSSNIDPNKKEGFFRSLFNTDTIKESPSYLSYTDPSKRITTYYAYGHDQATGEKQLKNWQVYNNPSVIKGESVAYSFTNAKLKKNDTGTISVYYYGEQEIQNDKAKAEVDPSLMERAQRTLAKEMGDDIAAGNTTPNFTIPKPYYINASGERIDLDWRLSMDGKDISIDFTPDTNEYPLAFDPTLSFTAPAQSNTGDVITGEAVGSFFGLSIASGDFNADGKMDLVIASTYGARVGRVYIFYNDGVIPINAAGADVIITGEGNYNRFGSSLTAADFNADGRIDLAVGALEYSNNYTGRVYVFYNDGSYPSGAASADVMITGETAGDSLSAVSSGDFNNDGKIDLVVGAGGYSTNAGRAYIFYNGSITTENASGADIIITGEASSRFGTSFTSGDLNSDGKMDLVVGAYSYSSNAGRSYVFYNDGSFGTVSCTTDCLASNADVIITGEASSQFGCSLAVGDFNSDGKADIAIGANEYNPGGNANVGRAYIFYNANIVTGSAISADVMIRGESGSNYFGISISTGDFNTDGRTDLIVMASWAGKAYIFYNDGSYPSNANTADVIITGVASWNGAGLTTGDFNGDGKTDFAASFVDYASSTGRTYIFYSQNGQVNTNQNITGSATSDLFGSALITGDFNADGRIDLAVGARGYSSNVGRTYIFYGDGQIPSTAATADVIITGESTSSFGGAMISGDLNSDGKTDLVIGAYEYSSWVGRAYIFYNDGDFGTVSCTTGCLASNADVIITGEATLYFGGEFALGDLNADGRIDLAVGSGSYSSSTGRTYIFYNDGSIPTTVATADVIITGEGGSFGSALSIGDLNTDGKADIAVSAPGYSSNTGRAYILYGDGTNNFGTASCSGTPALCNASDADIIIAGTANSFGTDLAIGDLNTDGRIDLIAGSGLYVTGNAFIFYNDGSYPATSATADIIITPYSGASGFGSSIITGDLNADGRTDVAIGSGRSLFTDETGRVDIFYNDGSIPTSGSSADVTIIGEAVSNRFGWVLAVGDLNADGRNDLAVGAPYYSSSAGRVYLYETRENFAWQLQKISSASGGLRTGLSGTGEEMKITGGVAGDYFGSTMTTGDFNADGKTDLVVGSYGYSTSTGRVYIFYGDGSIAVAASGADVVITGEATNNNFGYALSAGDLNSDGKIDLVVGAHLYSGYYGRVYVFYNDGTYPSVASNADVKIIGTYAHNTIGSALATGDFNTDGRTDLAIGAAGLSSSGFTTHAYILYNDGSYPSDTSSVDVSISSEGLSEKFGITMVTGDLNADGRIDIVVGANWYSSSTGRAYIFYNDGSFGTVACTTGCLAANADVIIQGTATSTYFSSSMTTGDFNTDGKTDIVIGATHTSSNSGAYIFYNDGSSFGTVACTTDCLAANADGIILGSPSSYFGTVSAGDFNGDGRIDLVVGAVGVSSYTGSTYIFYNDGSFGTVACTTACLAANADVILTGESTNNYFGNTFSTGDFNADGKADLAVGAYNYASSTGRIYLYTFNDPFITGEATSDYFGGHLVSGDFNADGKTDLVVRASGYSTNTGRVYVFYNDGSIPSLAASADVIITGEATNNYFGFAMTVGDFNSDGKTDLSVGAYGYSSNNGRAYIFYNGAITTESASGADVIITGTSSNQFGKTFASGDLNADGTTDLAVGNSGRNVYIFYNDGSYPASDSLANVNIDDGGGVSNGFGTALAAGDFNDDGRVDLAIGAQNYLDYTYVGRIYIFYNDTGGMPTTSTTADVTIDGEAAGYFGGVLTVDDFNADGKMDLASSARSYNSRGRVYIFYTDGASYPASAANADVIINSASGSSYFGQGITSGDLNADGRTDLIVGDTRAGGSFAGRVFVFYNDGSYPATTTNADAVMNGGAANDYFGYSMSTGDFNADGKTDLAVGAYGYLTSIGCAYIFTTEVAVKSIPDPVRTRGGIKIRGTSKIR